MARYTVVWLKSALDELAEIWLRSSDQQAVANAADLIDQALAADPDQKGIAVSVHSREFSAAPLTVLFSIRVPDRLVEVFKVKSS